jgi:hypothetical protein
VILVNFSDKHLLYLKAVLKIYLTEQVIQLTAPKVRLKPISMKFHTVILLLIRLLRLGYGFKRIQLLRTKRYVGQRYASRGNGV